MFTGLDGSGKSTFLKRVKDELSPEYEVLFSPFIHSEDFAEDDELYHLCKGVNTINLRGDELRNPRIKAIALLASMMLFRRQYEFKIGLNAEVLLCERMPLIDAPVYAEFYAPVAGEELEDPELDEINRKYDTILQLFVEILPEGYRHISNHPAQDLLAFIHRWFHLEKKVDLHSLSQLFDHSLPDEVFYLYAPVNVLHHRIKDRDVSESHETLKVLQLMSKVYEDNWIKLESGHDLSITRIDVTDFAELDRLFDEWKNEA